MASRCWDCRGAGRVWEDFPNGEDTSLEPCGTCDGSGTLAEES